MQVDLKAKVDEKLVVEAAVLVAGSEVKGNQQQAAKRKQQSNANRGKYMSQQDTQFLSQMSFLSQLSHFNLMEMNSIELCRNNQHTMRKLTNKKTIKLSPEMKYFYCKKCEIMLVPGETGRVRLKSKRNKHVVMTCLNCSTYKRYETTVNNKKT